MEGDGGDRVTVSRAPHLPGHHPPQLVDGLVLQLVDLVVDLGLGVSS